MSDDPTDGSGNAQEPPAGGEPTEPLIIPASDPPLTGPPEGGAEAGLPPTEAMPAQPPVAGAGAPGAPHDPNAAGVAGGPPPRWYENRAAVAAIVAVGLIGIFLIIGLLTWWSDDDDPELVADSTTTTIVETLPTASIVDGSTIPESTTTTSTTTTSTTTTSTSTTTTTTTTTTVAPTTAATTAPTTAAPTTPTTAATTTTVPVVTVPPSPAATLLDIIEASPDLSRLRQLLIDANLNPELAADGPLTLFAPSNPAIDTLEAAPGGAELLADPDRLRQFLLHHLVGAALTADEVFALNEVTTLAGDTIVIQPTERTVDGAMLVVTDVEGANGIIHVVDAVLLPAS